MRSLEIKLMLAFLLVGVIGAMLVAVLVHARTQSEFDRFVASRDETALLDSVTDYYVIQGGWDGLGSYLATNQQLAFHRERIIVTDARHVVVAGSPNYPAGQVIPAGAEQISSPLAVEGETVGFVFFLPPPMAATPKTLPVPEVLFLNRVTWATTTSAIIAAIIAVIIGGILAQTLTKPIRELTAATRTLAQGTFDHRVGVRSNDEIGELAASFNSMSDQLSRASQLRRQMTADLAHDLRTPLSILRGYTEGLMDGRLQGSVGTYTIMHEEVEHLQHLVDDLRVLSLADANELPLNQRVIDPLALIERTALAYVVQAEDHGLSLRVEAAEELPSIRVDTDRMTQVLNNLVSNALRHTQKGEIVLAATADNGHVELTISDTGSGIGSDDVPFIFDRFYRADKARQRTDAASSGLGLAIAKAIVEAHGGTIGVESMLDHGTTFRLTFPAIAPSQP